MEARRILVGLIAVGAGIGAIGTSSGTEPDPGAPPATTATTTVPATIVATPAPPPSTVSTTMAAATTTAAPSITTTVTTATTTTTVAPTTTTTLPARERIVIRATGDVSLDPYHSTGLAYQGHEYAWNGLEGLFLTDDLTIINLECAPSELGWARDKPYVFRCDPRAFEVAARFGVDVANLANNHTQDYGTEALVEGRELLADAGIAPVGAGADAAEAYLPALLEVRGWTVAVLGFASVIPPDWVAGEDRPGAAGTHDLERVIAAIRWAEQIADLVIVTVHWGIEFDLTPRPAEVELARSMIDAGADAIFGHHPHRLNPLDTIGGVPVAWSLGNFVWPKFSGGSATTAVAEVVFEPDGRMSARLIPAFIAEPGHPVLIEE